MSNSVRKMVGMRIREFRKIKGLTQAELAEKSGISVMSIRRYENGERVIPEVTMRKIAEVLDVSLPDLFIFAEGINALEEIETLLTNDELSAAVSVKDAEYHVRKAKLESAFRFLNITGQEEAVKRVQELSNIPEYQDKELFNYSKGLITAKSESDYIRQLDSGRRYSDSEISEIKEFMININMPEEMAAHLLRLYAKFSPEQMEFILQSIQKLIDDKNTEE